MIAQAFRSLLQSRCSAEIQMQMAALLSEAFSDLCRGQQLDLSPPRERRALAEIHELKTGALFAASVAFGVCGAGGSERAIAKAKQLGRSIGLAFQIVDDYLDIFGSLESRGRTESSDIRNNKLTFFNGSDKQNGLRLLEETRIRVEEQLSLVAKEAPSGNTDFGKTRKLLDSIFSRVSA